MASQKINETSTDLLEYMALYREEEPNEAEEAFNEFYRRYYGFVYTVVSKNCPEESAYYDKSLISSTINNTFHNVYFRAETFTRNGDENDEVLEKRVKAWLATIAKNEMKQLILATAPYLEKNSFQEDDKETQTEKNHLPPNENEHISFERSLIDRALATLSDRERDILTTYMRFQEGDKKLPREELERLTSYYDTTSDNVRKIKSRALNKVKTFIKQNSSFNIT